jgi:hypothetical protein
VILHGIHRGVRRRGPGTSRRDKPDYEASSA